MNDITSAIDNTIRLASNSEDLKTHLEGLVRKGRGSYVSSLDDLESTLSFLKDVSKYAIEVSHDAINAECPGAARKPARYFKADIGGIGYNAFESICLVDDLSNADLDNVRLRRGKHGVEFYIPEELTADMCPSLTKAKPTTTVWFILGPSEAGEVLWTWFPGRMTAGTKLDNHAIKLPQNV